MSIYSRRNILEPIKCKCGCGMDLNRYDKQGREIEFIKGHNCSRRNDIYDLQNYIQVPVNWYDDCWEWLGNKSKDGYGKVRWNMKHKLAHRLIFELCIGKLKKGELVTHWCDNPSCVNPFHLVPGDVSWNQFDKMLKGRGNNNSAYVRL